MSDQSTTDNFWAAWAIPPEPPKPVYRRLYYNEQGEPLFYSMEDLPGNYIELTVEEYREQPAHVRVVDGKLKRIKLPTVPCLVRDTIGTPCDPRDVSVVVSEDHIHQKWILK